MHLYTKDYEVVIVVDDCSTDDSYEAAKEIPPAN